ncbi:hypothetical protein Tco_0458047 [Tanacetum coccineum]
MTITNIFEFNHEDAYDSDVDESPNVAAAFMDNLSSTSATNSQSIRNCPEKGVLGFPANEMASQASNLDSPPCPPFIHTLPPSKSSSGYLHKG